MKILGISLLVALGGYAIGVIAGIGLVHAFSSPKPDKSVEAVVTGFILVGPAAAILSFLVALVYQLVRRTGN